MEFNWTNTFPITGDDACFWSVIAIKSLINALMKLYEPRTYSEPLNSVERLSKAFVEMICVTAYRQCDWIVDICKITKQHPSSTDVLCKLHVFPHLTNYQNNCVSSGTVLIFILTLVAFLMHFSGCGIHSFIP